jgi:pimeloyl-ACP methyl ester carboxylesterase
MAATRSAPLEAWWSGGKAPMLVIQGLEDRMAPLGNGRALREQFADRVELVELPNAAHLMALERPAEAAAAILAFLKQR